MIGLVLAAGAGGRLRPDRDSLPETAAAELPPGRYAMLEHLDLGAAEVRDAVTEHVALASDPGA